MALEALKTFAEARETQIGDKIADLTENDPTERPTSDFKPPGMGKPALDEKAVLEGLQSLTAGAYKKQQENIRAAGQLRADITKGIQAGQSTYRLLLKAMECISLMTGDAVFYNQGKNELQTLYSAFDDPEAKAVELEEAQQRLTRLLEAYKREHGEDGKRRIKTAIQRHEARIQELI